MTDWFGAVSAFGQEISVYSGGGVKKCRAFIQPLSLTSPEREGVPTPAGISDGRRYLIIAGPDALDGGAGTVIECNQRRFELLRCERMGGGSHWEGIMRPRAGESDA